MRRSLFALGLSLGFATVGCGADDDAAPVKGACAEGSEASDAACAEAQFWAAFGQPELAPRAAAEKTLVEVIARYAAPTDARSASLMHFRLGQLRLAMALENGQRQFMMNAQRDVVGEFDTAERLDDYDGIIAPWKDAMEIAMHAVFENWTEAVPLAERGFENVKLNPMGNTLSLSGTTIGFPLSTGVPQRTVALLDEWKCAGVVWCTENSDHAPTTRPGLGFHFAEAYARVGNREKTVEHLDAALSAPGAATWPYRHVAQEARDDVDAFLGKFSALGQDGSAFDIAYANQPYGCVFCHQR